MHRLGFGSASLKSTKSESTLNPSATPSLFNFLSRNLIKNPSGHENFSHWVVTEDGFEIESPPLGIVSLPRDTLHFRGSKSKDSAFVTSCDWSSMEQIIDLWEIGLTPEVMGSILPLQFKFSVMVGSRPDCGGKFKTGACFLASPSIEVLSEVVLDRTRNKGEAWTEITMTAAIDEIIYSSQKEKSDNIRYFKVKIEGQDDMFWEEGYGIKFSRISVTFQCTAPESASAELRAPLRLLAFDSSQPKNADKIRSKIISTGNNSPSWSVLNMFKKKDKHNY